LLTVAAAVTVLVVGAVTFVATTAGDDGPTTSQDCPVGATATAEAVAVGSRAPQFSLPLLDGGCFESSSYDGRPLVVNFWASWCNPCRREFPYLDAARDRYAEDDVEIIGVASKDITSDARRFADEQGAEWPLVDDDTEVVGDAFGVRSIPETFFIAADGTIVAHVFGLTSPRELDRHIEQMLEA
jgi:peroxiredoxin